MLNKLVKSLSWLFQQVVGSRGTMSDLSKQYLLAILSFDRFFIHIAQNISCIVSLFTKRYVQ